MTVDKVHCFSCGRGGTAEELLEERKVRVEEFLHVIEGKPRSAGFFAPEVVVSIHDALEAVEKAREEEAEKKVADVVSSINGIQNYWRKRYAETMELKFFNYARACKRIRQQVNSDFRELPNRVNEIKKETAKEVFEEQERHVVNELALVAVKIKREKDNPVWKQDKGNLEEWLKYIKDQRARFLEAEKK